MGQLHSQIQKQKEQDRRKKEITEGSKSIFASWNSHHQETLPGPGFHVPNHLNLTVDLDRPCAVDDETPIVIGKLENLSVNGSENREGSGNDGQNRVDVIKEIVNYDDDDDDDDDADRGGEENGENHLDVNEKKGDGSEENDHNHLIVKEFDRVDDDDEVSRIRRTVHLPVRLDAEDCAFYIRTGSCKFGLNCKFNHPVRRKIQAVKEKVKETKEFPDTPWQAECKYYLKAGGCKFGKDCKFNHTRGKPAAAAVVDFNFLGLPIRPGEKECPYYMRTGSCKYESNCWYNHPDPTAGGGGDPASGGSVSSWGASESTMASWPLYETSPFVPMMFSSTPSNHEWNGYEACVYPQERSVHASQAYIMNSSTVEKSVYMQHQQQMMVEEFPERPRQPECSYFLKTGNCKYRSACRYHHPKNRLPKSPPNAFSNQALPLKPQCPFQGDGRWNIP